MQRSIKVKIVSETPKKVTVKILSLNRNMPVPRNEYEERVESGLYEVVS